MSPGPVVVLVEVLITVDRVALEEVVLPCLLLERRHC
jgi:hypothetical protein